MPGTSLTGAGQSVGLLQFDGFYASDITTYESQAGLPNVPLTVVPMDGGVSTPGSGNGEVSLDIEMAISMAPGLSGIYVYEAPNPSPWDDLLNRMANDNLCQAAQLLVGRRRPRRDGRADLQANGRARPVLLQRHRRFRCLHRVDPLPVGQPNITQVGGTTLTTGAGAAYAPKPSGTGAGHGSYVGSSGGISTYYAIPSWQQGISMSANQGSTTMRNVPDVALTADNVYVVYDNGSTGTFGGTSCAAPLWAGFTALVNQQAVAAGRATVGFLNPALYTIGKSASYTSRFPRHHHRQQLPGPAAPAKFSAVDRLRPLHRLGHAQRHQPHQRLGRTADSCAAHCVQQLHAGRRKLPQRGC